MGLSQAENRTESRRLALRNARTAKSSLEECRLCAHDCRVDRSRKIGGVCQVGPAANVFYQGVEWGGESDLVPTFVISLSGCNMSCSFCLTGPSSQNSRRGVPLHPTEIAREVQKLEGQLTSITILGGEPSVHLPAALELIASLPPSLPIVWKTNAYSSPFAQGLLTGCVDVVLADLKFGNGRCAERLAACPRYVEVVKQNLDWSSKSSRLIVRHLLMPGHRECCLLPVLDQLAKMTPPPPLSLMPGFLPSFRASEHSELRRTMRTEEVELARFEAMRRGLTLVRWTLEPGTEPERSAKEVVHIDRQGRLLVDSASAELLRCLTSLDGEFREGCR